MLLSILSSSSFFFLFLGHGVLAAIAPAADTGMNSAEQEALFQVMEAMAGDVSWRSQHPRPCDSDVWQGLECEQDPSDGLYHVTRLDFGYKPNPSCSSNASFTPAITRLTALRSLFIFGCFTVRATSVPPYLGKLGSTLRELSLRGNGALGGEVPPDMAELSELRLLSLSQNGLKGVFPSAILPRLRQLQQLDLSDNAFTGAVPPEIGAMSELVILDLSSNSFVGALPPEIGNLTKLKKLDLSHNSFSGAIPLQIGNLQGLQFLAANQNLITGPLPASLSPSLQYLILDDNPINTTLPSFLGSFPNLMALSLSSCDLFGPLPPSLGLLNNLTVMSLAGNRLSGSIPPEFATLPRIYQLDLSNNSLSGSIPFPPEFVRRLGRNMRLSGNWGLCVEVSKAKDVNGEEVEGVPSCRGDTRYSTVGEGGSKSGAGAEAGWGKWGWPLLAVLLILGRQAATE